MALPELGHRYDTRPLHYSVAVVDGHGRIAASSTLRELGWDPGTAVAYIVGHDRLITASRNPSRQTPPSTAPSRQVTPRGHLSLPLTTRRRAGVAAGDRLLLAADVHADELTIFPPKILASILRHLPWPPDRQP